MTYRVYVAGPMTGYDDFNYPAFNAAARHLRRERGWEVINPAELDALTDEELGEGGLGDGSQLPLFLRRDFKELVHCDGVVLLDGWRSSPGANAELCVARFMDLDVWRLDGTFDLRPSGDIPTEYLVRDIWYRWAPLRYRVQKAIEIIQAARRKQQMAATAAGGSNGS